MPLTSKDATASKGGAGTGITAIIFKNTRTQPPLQRVLWWSGWVTVNWVNWVPVQTLLIQGRMIMCLEPKKAVDCENCKKKIRRDFNTKTTILFFFFRFEKPTRICLLSFWRETCIFNVRIKIGSFFGKVEDGICCISFNVTRPFNLIHHNFLQQIQNWKVKTKKDSTSTSPQLYRSLPGFRGSLGATTSEWLRKFT